MYSGVPLPARGRPVSRGPVDVVIAAMSAVIADHRGQQSFPVQGVGGRHKTGKFQIGVRQAITAVGRYRRLGRSWLPMAVSGPSWGCNHHRFTHPRWCRRPPGLATRPGWLFGYAVCTIRFLCRASAADCY